MINATHLIISVPLKQETIWGIVLGNWVIIKSIKKSFRVYFRLWRSFMEKITKIQH